MSSRRRSPADRRTLCSHESKRAAREHGSRAARSRIWVQGSWSTGRHFRYDGFPSGPVGFDGRLAPRTRPTPLPKTGPPAMHVRLLAPLVVLSLSVVASDLRASEAPLPEPWDYSPAMSQVAGRFRGRPGVVLHVGDSITYANPYSQWARGGKGKTAIDRDALRWMHSGAGDDSDGWWLASFDHPDGGRSHTACGGLRADELLAGGKSGLPSLEAMLERYRPQLVVLMIGTNDASAARPLEAYRADMEKVL